MSTTDTTPTNWPPQPGDIWTDQDGDDWFTVRLTHHELDDGEAVILVRASQGDTVEPDGEEPDDVRCWWGPLALAYRSGERPAASTPSVERLAEILWDARKRALGDSDDEQPFAGVSARLRTQYERFATEVAKLLDQDGGRSDG